MQLHFFISKKNHVSFETQESEKRFFQDSVLFSFHDLFHGLQRGDNVPSHESSKEQDEGLSFGLLLCSPVGGASQSGLTPHSACSNIQLCKYVQVMKWLPGKEEKVVVIDVFLTSRASTEKMFFVIT